MAMTGTIAWAVKLDDRMNWNIQDD
jgi:hypothetical protein